MRIHSQSAYGSADKKIILAFIESLQKAGIEVAGWGWCQGADALSDAKLAVKELSAYGLKDYIADIEYGVHDAHWTPAEVSTFCKRVRQDVVGSFGITTFPLIDWHEPELMKAALPYVDMFNPQVYWHHFPNKKMIAQFKRPNGSAYGKENAAQYAELCLDRWDKLMGADRKDIVITGQAYWGEGDPPFSREDAEDKLDQFLTAWTRFDRVIGLNWWHFGGGHSMTHRMLDSITKAKLGSKNYK